MKKLISRRSFLQAVGLDALSFGLAACSSKTDSSKPTVSDDEIRDGEDEVVSSVEENDANTESHKPGYTLAEAQQVSDKSNLPFFIHRTDDLFYPVPIPLAYCDENRALVARDDFVFSGYNAGNVFIMDEDLLSYYSYRQSLSLNISNGDELVYISTGNEIAERIPIDSVGLLPADEGITLPVYFEIENSEAKIVTFCEYTFSEQVYNDKVRLLKGYIVNNRPLFYVRRRFTNYDRYSGTTEGEISSQDGPIVINGLEFDEYISAHDMLCVRELEAKEYIVDLSSHASLHYTEDGNTWELIDADEECYVTIGFYTGTQYYETDLNALCKFYHVSNGELETFCSLELTKNGYSIVDISPLAANLESGKGKSFLLDCSHRCSYNKYSAYPICALITIEW